VEKNDPFHTDGYFYLIDSPNRKAQVKASVSEWMRNLEEHPRLKDNPQGSLASLLVLIQEHVLVVDPKQRMQSKELTGKLETVTEKAHFEAGILGAHSLQPSSLDDASEPPTSGTPAVTLDAPESATTPSLGSARRKRSTRELITAQPGSPAKQITPSGSRSVLPSRGAIGEQAKALSSSASLVSSSPPRMRPHFGPPPRTSTMMTSSSELSTNVEPAMTPPDERNELWDE
jgi:hypothetical protein